MAHNRCVIIGLCGDSTKHNLLRVKWAAGLVLLVLVIGAPARADDSGASRAAIRGTASAGVLARRAKALPVFKTAPFAAPRCAMRPY